MMVRQDSPGNDEAQLLPEPFWTADRASVDGQRMTIRWYRWQILLLVGAAVVSVFPGQYTPLLSVAAFLGAGYCWYRLRNANPQGRWHEARAAAESIKTLAWKYAVRARPFDGAAASAEAENLYLLQAGDVLRAFEDPEIIPAGSRPDITPAMRELRAAPLAVRRTRYLVSRVDNQRVWYRSRAEACESQSASWSLAIGALLILGCASAVAEGVGAVSFPAFAAFAAAAAAVIAWTQLKQLRPLAAAYLLAAKELELVSGQLSVMDLTARDAESTWSKLSADAEEAVSREHTTWRARRAFPR
ncbi:DUF4231 domain-containing protein [Kitasatospora paracochleata]|uniref:DUF4231 domain-containing protein n=1 Tax=Kitasatospora paracochleata TaxID=58354 RepID=A0ABT1J313_9ACTN|nr:DUF4231 domain-containing protein [Kitasatospora paracochleata]MCP2311820.1 hypothetical protein [Kitasatospora paracochleata]